MCGGEFESRGAPPSPYGYMFGCDERYVFGVLGGGGGYRLSRGDICGGEFESRGAPPPTCLQSDFSDGDESGQTRTPLPAARRVVTGSTAGSPFSLPPLGAPPRFELQRARGGCYDRDNAVTFARNCPPLPAAAYCPPCAPSEEEVCLAAALPRAQNHNGVEAERGEEDEGGCTHGLYL